MSLPKIANAIVTSTPLREPPLPAAAGFNAPPWALLLDVDGTLLGFADDPAAVRVDAALLALLSALQRALDGALALVSGRELADIDRLFGQPAWAAAGLHGLQLRRADGHVREVATDPQQQAHARRAVRALAAGFADVQIEDKHAAIALHCRRSPAQWPALYAACMALLPRLPGYELQPGNLVLEFKPAGMDKGRAVRELLAQPPFAGRTPVYLGDDLTDEYAFAAINQANGISVCVGGREPTQAHFTLPGTTAAEAWLRRVLHALTPGAAR